jgi:uncharacterized protein involved in outer membrane biogenesis
MGRYPKAKLAGAIALGVIAVVAAFLMLYDFKGLAERRASAALGRPVTIADLDFKLFPLEAVLSDLVVADRPLGATPSPDAKAKPPFMKAAHVDAVVGFWRLLAGDLVFRRLSVEDAVARVERDADGNLNWDAEQTPAEKPAAKQAAKKPADRDAPEMPEIRDLRLRDVTLHYRDPSTKTNLALRLDTRARADGGEPQLLVKGEGTYANQPTTITATAGSILALRDSERPYPIDGTMVSGPTSITVKGTVVDPENITGLNVNLTVKGTDATDLYRVAGIVLPATPPYLIETHVDRDGDKWIFKNLKWTMGKSDFAGELTWDVSEETPRLDGNLHANAVDLDDLGGFIGAAPGDAETPVEVRRAAAEREQQKRAQSAAPPEEKSVASELVIPDRTLDLEKLNSMNAKVHLKADRIIEADFPLDNFDVQIGLQDGVLTLKPLIFGVDKGRINIDITVNGRAQPVKTDVVATVLAFPLQRLVGKGPENTTWGAIGGHFEFHGTGDSMHRILATADGQAGFAVGGGQLSLFLVELMGVDLAEAVGIMLTKDKPAEIRCMVADFAIEKGKMTARAMVADTTDTVFRGNGSIDLGREVFDMRVHAKPKDVSPVTLRSKLKLTGTFADPSFGPDLKAMALRGGAAAVLGALLTPLASLLVLIDIGGGKDANCAALIEQAQK